MKVWVTGASGQVGYVLLAALKERGIDCVGTTRAEVEISDEPKVRAFAKSRQITHLINAAACSQVDWAEQHRDETFLANAVGPEVLARAAKEVGARFVHISTDYVFDGKLRRPYLEEDETNPVNWYGYTKREGEIRSMAVHPESCIVRISWVFGGHGTRHFAAQVLNLFKMKSQLSFVADQIGSPTYAPDCAGALIDLMDQKGIFHYCNGGQLSKYAFTRSIWEWAKQKGMPMICEEIIPICSSQFSTVAPRPLYTPLGTQKAESLLQIRPWREALEEYMCKISS